MSHLQGEEVSQRNWRLENVLGTTHPFSIHMTYLGVSMKKSDRK